MFDVRTIATSVAASLLATDPPTERDLVVINDDWPNAAAAGLPVSVDVGRGPDAA